jgi:hypothetical protein
VLGVIYGPAMPLPEAFWTSTMQAMSKLRHRSALQTLVWVVVVLGGTCFYLAAEATDEFKFRCFFFTGLALAAVFVGVFVMFAICAPDRLHDYEYLLRRDAMTMIQEKGQELEVLPTSLDAIAVPDPHRPPARQISSGSHTEEGRE